MEVCCKGTREGLDLDEKWKHKQWQWQRFEEERMIFRGGTCVEWAQVKGSGTMEGAGEVGWVGDAGMESEGKLSIM